MSEMRWKDLRDTDFASLKTLAEQFGVYTDDAIEQTEVISEDVVKKHIGVEVYESQTTDDVRAQANMLADGFQLAPTPCGPRTSPRRWRPCTSTARTKPPQAAGS